MDNGMRILFKQLLVERRAFPTNSPDYKYRTKTCLHFALHRKGWSAIEIMEALNG
jgi:hypothetical protein